MILVNDIRKSYGEVQALDRVSFSISKGEFFGLLGPNGAGKSTLIRILTGLTRADSGSFSICGQLGCRCPQSEPGLFQDLPGACSVAGHRKRHHAWRGARSHGQRTVRGIAPDCHGPVSSQFVHPDADAAAGPGKSGSRSSCAL